MSQLNNTYFLTDGTLKISGGNLTSAKNISTETLVTPTITIGSNMALQNNELTIGNQTLGADHEANTVEALKIGGKLLKLVGDNLFIQGPVDISGGVVLDSSGQTYAIPNPADAPPGSTVVVNKNLSYVSQNVSPGGDIPDYTRVHIGQIEGQTEYIRGGLNFGRNFDWSTGWTWKATQFSTDVLPPLLDKTGVDLALGNTVAEGFDPTDIYVDEPGENVFVLPTNEIDPTFFISIGNVNPVTNTFKRKFKADFGTPSTGQAVLKDYVQMSLHVPGTKVYIVEFIATRDSPFYLTENIANNLYSTLLQNNAEDRATSHYELAPLQGVYNLVSTGLFPYIGYIRWENSTVKSFVKTTAYREAVGWGTPPDAETVFQKYDLNGWLFALFNATYLSVKYGSSLATKPDDDITDITALYATNVANVAGHNLVFEGPMVYFHPDALVLV